MIRCGWKEIAKYLGSAVRTAQHWEGMGLPIKRPIPFWRNRDLDISASVQRARQLRREVKEPRELLRTRMGALKKELADIREKRRRKSSPGIEAP